MARWLRDWGQSLTASLSHPPWLGGEPETVLSPARYPGLADGFQFRSGVAADYLHRRIIQADAEHAIFDAGRPAPSGGAVDAVVLDEGTPATAYDLATRRRDDPKR